MRKINYLTIACLFSCIINAQKVVTDSVYVNKEDIVHLLFKNKILHANPTNPSLFHLRSTDKGKSPIIKNINGKDVVFIKVRKRFDKTSFIFFDDNDNYYDITIIYKDSIIETFHPIGFDFNAKETVISNRIQKVANPDEQDIFIEKVSIKDSLVQEEVSKFYKDTVRYKTASKLLYTNKEKLKKIARYHTKGGNVYLKFLNSYAKKDYLYFLFEIENNNAIPYIIDHWEFYVSDKREKQICNAPICQVQPIFEHDLNTNDVLPYGNKSTKVFVFKGLTLAPYQEFIVSMFQKGGNNHLLMDIENRYVNKSSELPNQYLVK